LPRPESPMRTLTVWTWSISSTSCSGTDLICARISSCVRACKLTFLDLARQGGRSIPTPRRASGGDSARVLRLLDATRINSGRSRTFVLDKLSQRWEDGCVSW
jgi:hypothetical protein